jgi:protein TonB
VGPVEFEVFEAPTQAANPIRLQPKPIAPPKPVQAPRAVFGSATDALKSDSGLEVKAGNTVAKAQDDLKLRDDDAKSLPIPTEEYLVTKMPTLVGDFRIPYPPEAKKKGVQGPVLMDLLIDTKGVVRQAALLQGPGEGLNEAALEAVKQLKFQPAEVEGKPVSVKIRYSYKFVLSNGF